MKVFTYKKCSTCQKATRWLKEHNFSFEELPIRETPPSIKELEKMLAAYKGEKKRLLNTSGQDYRAEGMKEKIAQLSDDELLKLLSENGNLIKRPFLISDNICLIGFKEEEWKTLK